MKKGRFFALLLAAALCFIVLNGVFAVKISAAVTGSGTQADPYIIDSESDLSAMSGSDAYFKLACDIRLIADNWTPINFSGVLDGNGYTLKFIRDTQSDQANVALFKINYGTIRNLNIYCNIYHKFYSPSTSGKMGGICITNMGTIANCNITGSLESNIFHTSYRNAYVGGICETNSGTIRDCGVYADIRGSSSSSYCDSFAAGICITNEAGATVTRCVVKGYIFTNDGGGGIAKTNEGTISECCVASSLSLYRTESAFAKGGTIENCINFSYQSDGTAIGAGHTNCIQAGGFWYDGTAVSASAVNSFDIGDQGLVSSGYGLLMENTYTEADFPGLDFENIWYITDYGVPYLRNLNLPKPQSVTIDCEDKLYVGGETQSEMEISPLNAVLYSLSGSFTEGTHELSWTTGTETPILNIRPTSAANTRLVISDASAGILGFRNFNFIQGVEEIVVTGPTRMAVGQYIQLSAVAYPENAENREVVFEESTLMSGRLTVYSNGLIKANRLGDAYVLVSSADGNVTVRYDIVVANIPTSVTLSETSVTLYPGETRRLSASVAPQDADDTSYRWESSDPNVASVDENGIVTSVGYGTAVIKAICNDGGAYGECTVTVAKQPDDFILTGPDTILVGQIATYKLEALPSDAVIRETHWQVDNESVAHIEQINMTTVQIMGIAGGQTQIQLYTGDRMMYLDLNVIRHPDSVAISEEVVYLQPGQHRQLGATVSPEDTTDKSVTWASGDETIASVSENGKITAHKVGEVMITCTTADGQKTDQVLVRVQIPASSLTVEETDITIYTDEIRKINAIVGPDDATYKNVVLTPNNNLLEVDQEAMSIRGLQAGTCVLQVSTPDGSLTELVFVTILKANHVYADPIFVWNDDFSQCTAERTCVNACPHTETFACTVSSAQQSATCKKEGAIVYTASAWIDGVFCKDTKTITIPVADHRWKDATCTEPKTCTVCGTTQGSAKGHSYNASNECACGAKKLAITTQPKTQKVAVGKTVKYTVKASGDGLKYQWQSSSNGKTWKNCSSSSAKKASFSFTSKTSHNGNYYRCKITDSEGNVIYTDTVRLYVLGVTTQPKTQKVKTGSTVKFTVKATGAGKTYQWQVSTDGKTWKNCSSSSAKKSTFTFTGKTSHSGNYYRCRIKDNGGNTVYTDAVKLYVLGITEQPVSKTVTKGKTAKFTVEATGASKVYQWQVSTDGGKTWKNCSSSSAKKATFSFTAKTSHNGNYYRCRVKDSGGNTVYTNKVKLTVKK
ncbi:MAG: Ig-like domain-containing protein [Oscillospiraceae bacterium]|nr:Ig-like domain-containing protein [Oscillospiraceae bacterium]